MKRQEKEKEKEEREKEEREQEEEEERDKEEEEEKEAKEKGPPFGISNGGPLSFSFSFFLLTSSFYCTVTVSPAALVVCVKPGMLAETVVVPAVRGRKAAPPPATLVGV